MKNEAVDRKRISIDKNVINTYKYAYVFQITTNSAGLFFIEKPFCVLDKIFYCLLSCSVKLLDHGPVITCFCCHECYAWCPVISC